MHWQTIYTLCYTHSHIHSTLLLDIGLCGLQESKHLAFQLPWFQNFFNVVLHLEQLGLSCIHLTSQALASSLLIGKPDATHHTTMQTHTCKHITLSHTHTHMQTHHTITLNSRIAFWCCFLVSGSMGWISSMMIFGNLEEETYKQATTQALHNTHKHARWTSSGHPLAILQWPYQHRCHWRHSWMNLGRQGFLFGLWLSWMLQKKYQCWLFCLTVCAF